MPKTPLDYVELAGERNRIWEGPEVNNTSEKTGWRCPNGHLYFAAYNTVKAGHGCPECLDLVNGALVSKNQRLLCEMLGGELNGEKLGRFTIDIVLRTAERKLAVEYDTWFYHSTNNERDRRKDAALLRDGWQILRIRTGKSLPSRDQLDDALARLAEGEVFVDLELEDWGVGPSAPWLEENENGVST